MDEPLVSRLLDGSDFAGRLKAIEQRLRTHAERETSGGLTAPDEQTGERWEAAQVWAHMAEFIGYWQGEIESVIGDFDGEPVRFGRIKTDPARIAAIELGRNTPIGESAERALRSLAELRRYLATVGPAEWNAIGRHETRGEMDVEAIVGRFLVSHLEEHLDQLDGLTTDAAEAPSAVS